MRVIITGGTGLIGSRLAASLAADGHEVIVLSRSPERRSGALPAGVRVVGWDGATAHGWGNLADGADAIVNLAGESIGGSGFPPPPWTPARKQRIRDSRLKGGQAVVEAVQTAAVKPKVVVQASAIGVYGPRGDEPITESASRGTDFLASVCADWEEFTRPVEALGVRRVVTRSGLVLSADGGVLLQIMMPFRLFAGGPLGSGKQVYSWIHLDDEIRAIRFLIEHDTAHGVYNLTAPHPLPNAELARIVGRVMRRPSFVPAPAFALKLALGEMSTLVLTGQRVVPERLQAEGFTFQYADLEPALRDLLGK